MLQVLDAGAVRAWCTAGRRVLQGAREELDRLNVFPVADADTGTNLLHTWTAADEAVRRAGADPAAVGRALAEGALLGARGNSGMLLSQLLRAVADALTVLPPEEPGLSAGEFARALQTGADLARSAVARPVEGTLLTVAAAAAAGARQAAQRTVQPEPALAAVVTAAREQAERTLERTPDRLPVLRDAGVVDAGGFGWVLLLRVLEGVVGREGVVRAAPTILDTGSPGDDRAPAGPRGHHAPDEYEVQYLLRDVADDARAALREQLARFGTSVAVVGGADLAAVHVHVPVAAIGPAVEAGLAAGPVERIHVTRLPGRAGTGPAGSAPAGTGSAGTGSAGTGSAGTGSDGTGSDGTGSDGTGSDGTGSRGPETVGTGSPRPGTVGTGSPRPGRLTLVVCPEGLGDLFTAVGAGVVRTDPAAPQRLAAAVRASGASSVVLVAVGDRAAPGAADLAPAGCDVRVVPVRSPVQALAALAVGDPARPLDEDMAAMRAAADQVRCAEVRPAVAAATTSAGLCVPGDALGVLDGRVVVLGAEVEAVARALLHRLVEAAELLTVVTRSGDCELGERLHAYVREHWPQVEVQVLTGGPEDVPVLLGAE